ncbi:hypothetical protein RR48_14428 [Papilio machaon]|uniref:Uncharacterized protein n=1 Tax=Papilio machaon TaxID=76193 RepID=A0A194QR28_PAPMA|nr:hypothetical protein RR48_14428 [Papilio machaon]
MFRCMDKLMFVTRINVVGRREREVGRAGVRALIAHARLGARCECARAAAAHARRQFARAFDMARWLPALVALAALLLAAPPALARKSAPHKAEPQIEEVTAKQLERILEDKDFVAVYWCKCGPVLAPRQACADGARPNGLSPS